MKRLLLTTIAAVLLMGFAGSKLRAARSPNIVLFLVDDMGWMHSEPYGSKYYETPYMEDLSKQSMRFANAYATPLCSPTRASILSGQYSSRHGVTSDSGHQKALPARASRYPANASPSQKFIYPISKRYLDPELVTMVEVLQGAGYRTGHIGKWHLGLSQEHWPEKHGFQVAFHAQPSPGPPGSRYFSPYGVHKTGEPSPKHPMGTVTDGPKGEYITDRLTDEAIRFVERHKNEPFFLNFSHHAVHEPWRHKEEYTKQFANKIDPRARQKNPIMASMLKKLPSSFFRDATRTRMARSHSRNTSAIRKAATCLR